MKYPTSSALENHFLQSILPRSSFFQEAKEIVKTKDFYQPDKFIWNNPHRTSSKVYSYYHKFNDEYKRYTQPKIKLKEQQYRIQKEEARISYILEKKIQTREAFLKRKKLRRILENKCFTNGERGKMNTVQIESFCTLQRQEKNNYQSAKNTNRSLVIQRSYQDALAKTDQRNRQIEELINYQREINHDRIRQKFQKRKQNNLETINRISRSKSRRHQTIGCM